MSRLDALAKQCGRRGGNCDCEEASRCRAYQTLLTEQGRIEVKIAPELRKLKEIERLKRLLTTPPARVKSNWVKPVREGLSLVAVNDAQTWLLYFVDDDDNVEDLPHGTDGWPFEAEYVYADDWERLGIRTEVA